MPKDKKDDNNRAEYSMGLMDYQRFNEILMKKADIELEFFQGNRQYIKPFYAILKAFYKELRPVFYHSWQKELDDQFNKLDRIQFNHVKQSDFKTLEILNDSLMEKRQKLKIGIPMVEKRSDRARITAGFSK